MLKPSLCGYIDAYILLSGTITIIGDGADDNVKRADEKENIIIFNNCGPFTDWISEISNTWIDNTKDIDVVMPMCNLKEYSNNYSKSSGSLWQCYRDEPNDNTANTKNSW